MSTSRDARRGRATLTGLLWPLGLAITATLGMMAGSSMLQNTVAPASGDDTAESQTQATSQGEKKQDDANDGAATGGDRLKTAEGANSLIVSHNQLVFSARNWLPFFSFTFDESPVTLLNVSEKEVKVMLVSQDIAPAKSNLRATPPGQISLEVKVDAGKEPLLPLTSFTIAAGQSKVLNVRPPTIDRTGVYDGTIRMRITARGTEAAEIQVKVITTHRPLLPLLVVTAGVMLVTCFVLLRTKGRAKTLILLRAGGLRLRLREIGTHANNGRFSSRLDQRCRDLLRQAMRNWQQQNIAAADTKLEECETRINEYADATASTENAAAALQYGEKEFVSDNQKNRLLAGALLLKQAETSLAIGDAVQAKKFAEKSMKVYEAAFGLYQRLKLKHQKLHELTENVRLTGARIMVDQAAESADSLIDTLSPGSEAVDTAEANQALQRLDYWHRALGVVNDAMSDVPEECATGQRRLNRAAELLAEATLENVRLPRAKEPDDNLQKAEQEAGAALDLWRAQPHLDLLKRWCPVNNGSPAASAYALAESEALKEAADAGQVLANAHEAAAHLQCTELERAAWQWSATDARQESLEKARMLVNDSAFKAALQELPWENSYPTLASMLQNEQTLFESCQGLVPTSRSPSPADLDPQKQIVAVNKILNQRDAQQTLARHYLFELDLRKLPDAWPKQIKLKKEAEASLQEDNPFEALRAVKKVLDSKLIQSHVAEALLAEAEMVNHEPNDVAWDLIMQARDELAIDKCTHALWTARSAWLLSREQLADYYLQEVRPKTKAVKQEEPEQKDQANQQEEGEQKDPANQQEEGKIKVIVPGEPGSKELIEAERSIRAEHWSEAVYQAHAAYRIALPKLAKLYVERLEGKAADEAKAFLDNGDDNEFDIALRIAMAKMAKDKVTDAGKEAKDKVTEAGKEAPANPALATAEDRLARGWYFRAYQAAKAALTPAPAPPKAGQAKSAVARGMTPTRTVRASIFSYKGTDASELDTFPKVRKSDQRVPAATAKGAGLKLGPYDEPGTYDADVDQLPLPSSWKKIVKSCLEETDDAKTKMDFVKENAVRIALIDPSKKESEFGTILNQMGTNESEAKKKLQELVDLQVICQNVGVSPKDCENQVTDETKSGWLKRLLDPPRIDDESSVDDPFVFEARIKGADEQPLEHLEYEWKVEQESRNTEWLLLNSLSGPSPVARIEIDKPGLMKVTCTVSVTGDATTYSEKQKFFRVRASSYHAAVWFFNWNSLLEIVFVVVVASLLGLLARFYIADVETFGSFYDYLLAFVWGATSKYGQEGFKSLTGLLASSFSQSQPSSPGGGQQPAS